MPYLGLIILASLAILYFLYKYMYNYNLRFFTISHLIGLEPYNRDFCKKISEFIRLYRTNEEATFEYGDDLKKNIYFYNDLNSGVIYNTVRSIDNIKVADNKSIKDIDEGELSKFINVRFNWSGSEKMHPISKMKGKNEKFFEKIRTIVDQQTNFEMFLEKSTLFNYLDLENMDLNNFARNKLFKKYGIYLPRTLGDYIKEIDENSIEKFDLTDFASIQEPPIDEYFDDFMEKLKAPVFRYYRIDENVYKTYKEKGILNRIVVNKCATEEEDEATPDDSLDADEVKEVLDKLIEFEKLKTEKDLHKLYDKYYFMLESFVFTTFTNEDTNMFSYTDAYNIITVYQNILDMVYIKTDIGPLELAVKFTIRYMLDTDKQKEDKLEQISQLYVAYFDLCMYEKKHKKRLDLYNMHRKPTTKFLEKMYKKKLYGIYDFFIKKGVVDVWKSYFRGERPKRYAWVLDMLRPYVNSKKIISILWTENDKAAEERNANSVETFVVVEKFKKFKKAFKKKAFKKGIKTIKKGAEKVVKKINPLDGILDAIKKITSFFETILRFLKNVGKVLKNILNPLNIISYAAKLMLTLILLILSVTYGIPATKGMLLGELFVYYFVLIYLTIFNIKQFFIFYPLTWIISKVDILLKGIIYVSIYRNITATENPPDAWYRFGGYHYDNKNERNYVSFLRCGDNYGKDPDASQFVCKRKNLQEPRFCYQANIYRLKENLNMRRPILPGSFYPSLEFMDSTKTFRKKEIDKFKTMKYNFYNHCSSSMQDYDTMTKNICRVGDKGVLKDSKKANMHELCYHAYCTNGKREQFCYKYTDPYTKYHLSESKSVFARMFFVFVYILILTYIVKVMIK